MRARTDPKVDQNQGSIVAAFDAVNIRTQSLARVGDGCPDLVVGIGWFNPLVEIKNPERPPSQRRLTAKQKPWHAGWTGKVHVIETIEQAMMLVRHYRKLNGMLEACAT